jgi:hypothetical protein
MHVLLTLMNTALRLQGLSPHMQARYITTTIINHHHELTNSIDQPVQANNGLDWFVGWLILAVRTTND